MKRVIVLFAVLALVALGAAWAEGPGYIGAAKCKMCHKVEFASWETTPHAKAFDRLKPEDHGKAECLGCHATGKDAANPGVQCEACHGPGSEYKSMAIMKDTEKAKAAGLVVPDETTCKGCHEGKAPHELKPFNFAEAKKTGLHEVKPKG